MFKVNNKDTRTTGVVSIVSIVNFEHVNADWVFDEWSRPNTRLMKYKNYTKY